MSNTAIMCSIKFVINFKQVAQLTHIDRATYYIFLMMGILSKKFLLEHGPLLSGRFGENQWKIGPAWMPTDCLTDWLTHAQTSNAANEFGR